ncbi:MAG: hypothetical protein Barrevirus22_5 [Barrevirus sp.]|uniref:Uncharacterized protein n=1 Tax=Barrevirus sp. TaxID=2487763 RepID=A0A3G4ZUZ1_9VIRU|nr:MAG: hypothetical protein Barrevirus22_5 [Barrevirus sp.]
MSDVASKTTTEKPKKAVPKCGAVTNGKPCINGASANGYCGKHVKYADKKRIEADGTKKVCSNFKNRKCINSLDINSQYSKCDSCREIDRAKYQKKISK